MKGYDVASLMDLLEMAERCASSEAHVSELETTSRFEQFERSFRAEHDELWLVRNCEG